MVSPTVSDEAEMARAATPGASRIFAAVAAILLCGLTLAPLFCVAIPALVDYPNHLARMSILVDGGLGEVASNYLVHWRFVPNLGIDLVVPVLAQAMPLETAGRVFIALTMLSLVAGTLALHRALRGGSIWWPLASVLFLYNAALFWGFLNCLLGIGLYLLVFAGWIASRHWPSAPRVGVFAILGCGLLVVHLFAFAVYALTVGAYELEARLARRPAWRKLGGLCVAGFQFLPALALWWFSPAPGSTAFVYFGGFHEKLYAALSPLVFGEKPTLLEGVTACAVGFLLYWMIRSRRLALAPGMRLPLLALGVAAAAMPNFLGGSWLADIRIPVALPFIALAATKLRIDRRAAGVIAAAAMVLLAVRVLTIAQVWRDADQHFAEFRAAATSLHPGSRLLVVEASMPEAYRAIPGLPAALGVRSEASFSHLPGLAVIDRAVFFPYLFTGLTTVEPAPRNAGLFETQGQPLTPELLEAGRTPERMAALAAIPSPIGELPYWGNWPKHFDFVLWIDFGDEPSAGREGLQQLVAGSFFRLYRVGESAR